MTRVKEGLNSLWTLMTLEPSGAYAQLLGKGFGTKTLILFSFLLESVDLPLTLTALAKECCLWPPVPRTPMPSSSFAKGNPCLSVHKEPSCQRCLPTSSAWMPSLLQATKQSRKIFMESPSLWANFSWDGYSFSNQERVLLIIKLLIYSQLFPPRWYLRLGVATKITSHGKLRITH